MPNVVAHNSTCSMKFAADIFSNIPFWSLLGLASHAAGFLHSECTSKAPHFKHIQAMVQNTFGSMCTCFTMSLCRAPQMLNWQHSFHVFAAIVLGLFCIEVVYKRQSATVRYQQRWIWILAPEIQISWKMHGTRCMRLDFFSFQGTWSKQKMLRLVSCSWGTSVLHWRQGPKNTWSYMRVYVCSI